MGSQKASVESAIANGIANVSLGFAVVKGICRLRQVLVSIARIAVSSSLMLTADFCTCKGSASLS